MRSPGSRSSVRLLPCSATSSSCACSTTATTRRSRTARSTTSPYGGGAGMVLRVDVVAAALDAVYGGAPEHRVVALTPQGRQLTQDVVEELAQEERLTLLSARFEGFDERVGDPPRLGRDLDRPVRALRRRAAGDGARSTRSRGGCPGALGSEESGLVESFSAELDGGLEYPHYTRPSEFRGWRVPDVLLSGDHGRIDEWRKEQSRLRAARRDRRRATDDRPGATTTARSTRRRATRRCSSRRQQEHRTRATRSTG